MNFRKTFFSLIFVVAAFIILDQAFGRILDKCYFSQRNSLSYALNDVEEQMLVMGYSRAQNHYIPQILQDSTGLSCYNFGSGGQNIYYQYALLNTILMHHTPKVILLELGSIDYSLTRSSHNKDKLSLLAPLYHHSSVVAEMLDGRDKFEHWKYYSQLYAFNSSPSDILYEGLKGDNNAKNLHQGYIPLYGQYTSPIANKVVEYTMLDDEKINCLQNFITLCNKNSIDLIITISPRFELPQIDLENEMIVKIEEQNVTVLNYAALLSAQEDQKYFKDILHLNSQGAEYYNPIIASAIKMILNT